VPPDRIADLVAVKDEVVDGVGAAGFAHVTVDLAGYRRGSLNQSSAPRRTLPLA
jgi:PP-loop superfamily ATP-utilizing enzyme